jgi:hypothetical protein
VHDPRVAAHELALPAHRSSTPSALGVEGIDVVTSSAGDDDSAEIVLVTEAFLTFVEPVEAPGPLFVELDLLDDDLVFFFVGRPAALFTEPLCITLLVKKSSRSWRRLSRSSFATFASSSTIRFAGDAEGSSDVSPGVSGISAASIASSARCSML